MNRPKGTKDIFGKEQVVKKYIKEKFELIASLNNFNEIETPIFEKEEVFSRGVGDETDIVSKEMYSFLDKKSRKMTLRPEGTASVMRAIIENKLHISLPFKSYYFGPMFRYERPQKGRQRQFHQFGVEMISDKNPLIDAEIIMFSKHLLDSLDINYEIKINSLGDEETRKKYSLELKKYFSKYKKELSEDSIKRLEKNPMRILDDKEEIKKDFVINAPKISSFYSKESKLYFDEMIMFLKKMDVNFSIDENLVRGLDYYSDTAFEFISTSGKSGSQSTLLGGGRYSTLLKKMGGPDISGIGFAVGIERIMNELDIDTIYNNEKNKLDCYVIALDEESKETTLAITHLLRKSGFSAEWTHKGLKMQKAFKKADKFDPLSKIIIGSKEVANNKVNVKIGNKNHDIEIDNLIDFLDKELG